MYVHLQLVSVVLAVTRTSCLVCNDPIETTTGTCAQLSKDTFVWDPVNEVPTLHLNMHITSLSCIPSQDLFESVLTDFNTLVRTFLYYYVYCMGSISLRKESLL